MPNNTRLNDLQLVLLSHAAKSESGGMLPLPDTATLDPQRTARELKSLLRRKLIEEVEATDRACSWRSDCDLHFGLQLTDAAREALGIEGKDSGEVDKVEPEPIAAATPAPRAGSKIAIVIALLQRKQGATLGEMIEATCWLPHTTRAALTGLKKKGHTIARDKRGETTCYRITASA